MGRKDLVTWSVHANRVARERRKKDNPGLALTWSAWANRVDRRRKRRGKKEKKKS